MQSFLVLLLAYTLSQFYRSFLAVISADLSRDIGIGPAELGNISAIWFVAFALAQFPAGIGLDRYGPRRTLAAFMLAAVAGALWLALARSYAECLAAMALIGAGCAPVLMAAMYVFAHQEGGARFTILSTSIIGFGTLGNLAGTTPLALAVEGLGWRVAIVPVAALTALSALVVALRLRDPDRPASDEGWGSVLTGFATIARLRALWPLLPITVVSYAVVIATRSLWISPFLESVYGLDLAARGNAALAMALAMVVGALAFGPADKALGHKAATLVGAVGTALAFVTLGLLGHASLAVAVALFAAIGAFGMSYAVLMAHAREFIPPRLLGRGVTFMNFFFIAGAGLVQALSGLFVQASVDAGLAPALTYGRLHLTFGIALLAAAAIYGLAPNRTGAPGPLSPARRGLSP